MGAYKVARCSFVLKKKWYESDTKCQETGTTKKQCDKSKSLCDFHWAQHINTCKKCREFKSPVKGWKNKQPSKAAAVTKKVAGATGKAFIRSLNKAGRSLVFDPAQRKFTNLSAVQKVSAVYDRVLQGVCVICGKKIRKTGEHIHAECAKLAADGFTSIDKVNNSLYLDCDCNRNWKWHECRKYNGDLI
jgi:hypothetical protein